MCVDELFSTPQKCAPSLTCTHEHCSAELGRGTETRCAAVSLGLSRFRIIYNKHLLHSVSQSLGFWITAQAERLLLMWGWGGGLNTCRYQVYGTYWWQIMKNCVYKLVLVLLERNNICPHQGQGAKLQDTHTLFTQFQC